LNGFERLIRSSPPGICRVTLIAFSPARLDGRQYRALLPDVPTVGDFVPGCEASGIQGLWAPKSTPPEVIATLNKATNAALADPKFKEHLGEFGNTLLPGSTAEYGTTTAAETEKWTKVIRAANTTSG
jgi:tripartite-type tricarboxylate transporter receptor subunit TctC